MDVKILNKTDGLMSNTSPTGITYKIVPVEHNNALSRVVSVSGGNLPMELAGMFTTPTIAQQTITSYLLKRWDESDAIAEKNKKRA